MLKIVASMGKVSVRSWRLWLQCLWAAPAVAVLLAGTVRAADPDALWKIVHGKCVPHMTAGEGPAPCSLVDLAGGYAVLKDIRGATQFLLIPTARVAGIESPAILAPGAPNYWRAAWVARRFVDERAGRKLPPEDISLAINAATRRSQNQLHIHVDCIRPDVKAVLAEDGGKIGTRWMALMLPPAGHPYMVRRIDSPDLAGLNPFRIVAETLPGAAAAMGAQTMVLAGAPPQGGQAGFYLLDDHVDPAAPQRGWGEELQDHDCALAKAGP
jgi:CDP-diacylglycerol pyrophosphatase